MAKGSVRKKGKKWYYRFYVEDASGNRVQKEFPGTESKSETESLLRKAMEDYETKMFLAQAKNITLGDMLDMWVEEELKPGSLSDGTVTAYINTVSRIKKHPIGKRKLKTVTSDHLQSYMDLLSFGGTDPDGKTVEALSKGSLGQYSAVLQNSFRFAVFPKRLITFNPMQYVVKRIKGDEYELFTEDGTGDLPAETPTISHEQYLALNELLKKNAEKLKIATTETARQSERGIVDMDTLKATNESLISTLDEVMAIQREGREKRQAAEAELRNMEQELKGKLLQLHG